MFLGPGREWSHESAEVWTLWLVSILGAALAVSGSVALVVVVGTFVVVRESLLARGTTRAELRSAAEFAVSAFVIDPPLPAGSYDFGAGGLAAAQFGRFGFHATGGPTGLVSRTGGDHLCGRSLPRGRALGGGRHRRRRYGRSRVRLLGR